MSGLCEGGGSGNGVGVSALRVIKVIAAPRASRRAPPDHKVVRGSNLTDNQAQRLVLTRLVCYRPFDFVREHAFFSLF